MQHDSDLRIFLLIKHFSCSSRNLRRAQYQITTRNLGLVRNQMRKQQWTNVLRNIEKLKKLVRISLPTKYLQNDTFYLA
jgi:hypothetical protein